MAKGCKARITIPKVLQMVWASSTEDHYSRGWRVTAVGGVYSVKWLNGEQRSLGSEQESLQGMRSDTEEGLQSKDNNSNGAADGLGF